MQLAVVKLIRELQPRILDHAIAKPDLSAEYQPAVQLNWATSPCAAAIAFN
jgi:hypothetical protein